MAFIEPMCIFTSASELANTKCAKQNTGALWNQENMTEMMEPTWWSPAGELRWAEYHFMNVPLERFSLSCINLCALPALVERKDAFMCRRSSDLHSTTALFTPSTSSPTVSHWTTRVMCDCFWSDHQSIKPYRFQQAVSGTVAYTLKLSSNNYSQSVIVLNGCNSVLH